MVAVIACEIEDGLTVFSGCLSLGPRFKDEEMDPRFADGLHSVVNSVANSPYIKRSMMEAEHLMEDPTTPPQENTVQFMAAQRIASLIHTLYDKAPSDQITKPPESTQVSPVYPEYIRNLTNPTRDDRKSHHAQVSDPPTLKKRTRSKTHNRLSRLNQQQLDSFMAAVSVPDYPERELERSVRWRNPDGYLVPVAEATPGAASRREELRRAKEKAMSKERKARWNSRQLTRPPTQTSLSTGVLQHEGENSLIQSRRRRGPGTSQQSPQHSPSFAAPLVTSLGDAEASAPELPTDPSISMSQSSVYSDRYLSPSVPRKRPSSSIHASRHTAFDDADDPHGFVSQGDPDEYGGLPDPDPGDGRVFRGSYDGRLRPGPAYPCAVIPNAGPSLSHPPVFPQSSIIPLSGYQATVGMGPDYMQNYSLNTVVPAYPVEYYGPAAQGFHAEALPDERSANQTVQGPDQHYWASHNSLSMPQTSPWQSTEYNLSAYLPAAPEVPATTLPVTNAGNEEGPETKYSRPINPDTRIRRINPMSIHPDVNLAGNIIPSESSNRSYLPPPEAPTPQASTYDPSGIFQPSVTSAHPNTGSSADTINRHLLVPVESRFDAYGNPEQEGTQYFPQNKRIQGSRPRGKKR